MYFFGIKAYSHLPQGYTHHIEANHGGFPKNAAKSSELIPTGTARGSELIAALNRLSSVDEVLKASPNLTGWRLPCKGAGRRGWWIGNLGKRWVGTRAEVLAKVLDALCSVGFYCSFAGHLSERTNDLILGPSSILSYRWWMSQLPRGLLFFWICTKHSLTVCDDAA